jgi:CheY-like chemotaxis protein
VAENGEDCLKKFHEKNYDYVFMDISMPIMDGITAVKEIRKFEREHRLSRTPIIVLTGHALEEFEVKAFLAGGDSYLKKPLTRKKALKAITDLL